MKDLDTRKKKSNQYRKQNENGTAPWQQLNNIDEILWDGRYDIRIKNNDTTMKLPFELKKNETATLIVEDQSHKGKLQHSRVIVQTISKANQESGKVVTYSRTYHKTDGKHKWSEWRQNANAAGEAGNENAIIWNSSSHIDTYITAGVYNISGERTNVTDGLPIANASPGHSFHARLVVLDSSIPGNGQTDDKCITQLLMLSNRTGGDGDVYVRTGRAVNKNQLSGGNGWEPWGKLQQNIEVGQVTSLNSYTDNGVYSGIYTNGTTLFETFVMVVINNYAVAGATGKVRSISQFKHALNIDGTFSYKTRTGQGNTGITWGEWVDLGAATTSDIQDNSITAQKLSIDIRENVNRIPGMIDSAAKEKRALVNGDTIVGLAREVYSRQGKTDTSTFLKRTTAGGTSISDGVATLKQIGGNILKNNLDIESIEPKFIKMENRHGVIVIQPQSDGVVHGSVQLFVDSNSYIDGHVYYTSFILKSNVQSAIAAYAGTGYNAARRIVGGTIMPDVWTNISGVSTFVSGDIANNPKLALFPFGTTGTTSVNNRLEIFSMLSVDLTEMYGAGNEPSKEECDKMFGTMDALPKGLTIAQPTGLKSTGFNQWNPANVLLNKSIVENAIEDDVADRHIAIVECLPCKIGTGENNGYIIGYGEGDSWNVEGIEVYFSPLNPMDYIGQDVDLYMHKLEPDSDYSSYVPQCKGYLLIVTPTIDKLCVHFHWSGDRAMTDYEPYVESVVSLPQIPQMSEWGLAAVGASGTIVQDTIDLDKMVYTKRIGRIDLGTYNWTYYPADATHPHGFFVTKIADAHLVDAKNLAIDSEYHVNSSFTNDMSILGNATGAGNTLYLINSSISDASLLKDSLRGICLYYQINDEEYPIVSRIAPNYIGSDYGTECFVGSKVPLAANILFYMRSLVSETRNFLDRLMAGLGVSDVTTAADRIIATIMPGTTPETELEIE